jgi:peroxiredoxin
MKKKYFALCVLFSFISCHKKSNDGNTDLFSIKLVSSNDLQIDFSKLKNNKATVFVFLAPDCPLSQNYTLTLNSLNKQFQKDAVEFYGIISGKSFEKKEAEQFVDNYKIRFPVLLDKDFILADYFKAEKTPEVFVVNPGEKILYKGAIDNWASDLGIHRAVITGFYLEDALKNIAQNKEVNVKETKAVGCYIERNIK